MPKKINARINKIFLIGNQEDVFTTLKTSIKGLNHLEIDGRLKQYGSNEIKPDEKTSLLIKFLSRFTSPLIIVLFIIGTISWVFGDMRSSTIIYMMIALSVITDFIQEYKSEKTVEKLKEKVTTKVEVIRDGKREMINAAGLVPGDVVCLSVGCLVPADARVVEADDFFTNESAMTGEAFPVAKEAIALSEIPAEINAYRNVVFMGTEVVSGYGKAVIFSTGAQTVFGRIAVKLEESSVETEFEKGVRGFGTLIVRVILLLVLMIFVVNSLVAKHDFMSSLMFSLALAVGLTPELLPMIMSITLARGSYNMSKQGVIVKRLNSIHDFGGMEILCTDKTGTLTENRIELVKHVDILGRDSNRILDLVYLNSYFQSGIANPLDEAVLRIKEKAKVKYWHKLDEIPFDFKRRRLSVVLQNPDNILMISKGAPEEMFSVCESYEDADGVKPFDDDLKKQAMAYYQELSSDGFRALALAYRPVAEAKNEYSVSEEAKMVLLGFVAFLDPPKKGVKRAIDLLESQGLEIKIITGDNELITAKICKEVDIDVKGILTGAQIEAMSDDELNQAVITTTIFARVSPEQKARVVTAVRATGKSVGYMGDGINDALPLKAADVGISVNNGVDVAKEAADLILLTKDLKVLSMGVTEGRKTFGNTLKYILMGLSSNFGNMFSVAAASFMLPFLPMLPIQIILNNFLYDFSQVTIPLDNVDDEYVKKPKRWDLKFIKKFMLTFGPISSIFDLTTFAVMLYFFKSNEHLFQTAWFIESLATQTLVIFIIRTRKLPFIESRPSKYLVASVLSFVVLACIIPFTPIASYFNFVNPGMGVMAAVWFIVLAYLLVVEFAKRFIYRKYFV